MLLQLEWGYKGASEKKTVGCRENWKGKCFGMGTGGVSWSKAHHVVMVRTEKKRKPREGLELQLEGARRGLSK